MRWGGGTCDGGGGTYDEGRCENCQQKGLMGGAKRATKKPKGRGENGQKKGLMGGEKRATKKP